MTTNAGFRVLDSVEIPMRDGTILRADIWLPAGDRRWPILLQRTAYRKEDAFGTQYISGLEFMAALRRGYAVVVQDTRGRYASDGAFDPFVHEADDGVDTIAWLARQTFSTGEVMMFGGSYVGATQVLAAAAHAEGLLAVSPHLTTARHGETWTYRSGAMELGFLFLWIIESLGPEDLARRIDTMPPDDAARAKSLLALMQADPAAAFARLPLLDDDLLALAPYASQWLDDDRAAQAGNDRENLAALASSRMPFLISCGWNDLFVEGAIELFETVRSRSGVAESVRDRLIIGPWSHGNPSDWQGDAWHGYAASTAGLSDEQLTFFDDALAGRVPATPVVRYFRSGSNSWHGAPDWPLPGATTWDLFLSGSALSSQAPHEAASRSYLSDTRHPVPTIGGANFVPGLLQGRNSGPKDQASIEGRDDVLVFTSEAMTEDIEITGLVEAELWVSATGTSADWTVRLCVVDETGRSVGLVDGIHRQRQTSIEPTKVTVRVGHISHLFAKGTRLRIQVASSNFPRFDRNPQTGAAPTQATAADFRPAEHTLHFGGATPSRLILPVVPVPCPHLSKFA